MRVQKNSIVNACLGIMVVLFMNSCVINKPTMNDISKKDYNERQKVNKPYYVKRLSVPGIVLTAAAPVAGAVVGYNINMISVQKGEETVPVKPANAAIGAVAGYTLANFINYCAGFNKHSAVSDPNKWVKSLNKNYSYIPGTSTTDGFYIIDNGAEQHYKVRNFEDTKQFYAAFPSSLYRDPVFKQSINVCSREELLALLDLDRFNQHANDAKKAYIELSLSYEDLALANAKFPEISCKYEERYASLVRNVSNAVDFHRRYPNSSMTKSVIWKAFSYSIPSVQEMNSLKNSYGNALWMTENDMKNCRPSNLQKANYVRTLYRDSNIKNGIDLELFYDKYEWLTYDERASDIVSNAFDVAYNSYEDGNYLLYNVNKLADIQLYKDFGVTKQIVQETINKKMEVETEKVKIVSTNSMGQNSSDWDAWVANTTYTAGLVAESGKIKYIIYGEIENKSKFDLPVVISASADLFAETSMKTKGGVIGQFFSALFDAASRAQGLKEKKVSSCKQQFIIPSLPAKSKSSYAIVLDFGNSGNVGVNVADWFKLASECKMKNLNVSRTIEKKSVSNSVLNEQKQWLDMARNGMPNTPLTDLKRGERVDQSVWAQRWQEELRARERAREYERQHASDKDVKELKEALAKTQYKIKDEKTFDATNRDGIVTEYKIEFSDGKSGWIARVEYPEDDTEWYYFETGLGLNDPTQFLNGWKLCDSYVDAINALYEKLH